MKLKKAGPVLGLILSTILAAPVVFAVNHHVLGTGNPIPTGTSVCYFSGAQPPAGEIFANWVTQLGVSTLTFGINNSSEFNAEQVGLRVDCNTSQVAKNFTMDVNTTNGNSPLVSLFAYEGTNSAPTFAGTAPLRFGLNTGYSISNLTNGYQRINFDAKSGLPANSRFSNIFFEDGTDNVNSSCTDSVRNVIVNGVPMQPNIQSNPTFDCTLEY